MGTADFTYTGHNITWFHGRSSNRGIRCVNIYDQPYHPNIQSTSPIYNRCLTDFHSQTIRQIGTTIWMPQHGTYRIITTGSAGFDVDAFAVDIQRYSPGRWRADNPGIRKNRPSDWSPLTYWPSIPALRTNVSQANMRITMDAPTVTINYIANPDRGDVAITINGYPYTINMYSPDSYVLKSRTFLVINTGLAAHRTAVINVSSLNQSAVDIAYIDGGYSGGAFFSQNGVGRSNLTWKFIGDNSFYSAAQSAISEWHSYTNLNLVEVSATSNADITIHAANNFNYTQSGILGFARICTDLQCYGENDTAFIDDGKYVSCAVEIHTNNFTSSMSKKHTILHELGHCFSLNHRRDFEDPTRGVMVPNPNGVEQLNQRDIGLINTRYP